MGDGFKKLHLDRRTFVVRGSKAVVLLGLVSQTGHALAGNALATDVPAKSVQFLKAYDSLVGTAHPVSDLVWLTLPDFFDNGHAVPFTISVDSPMTDASYVSVIHIVSTANPVAKVASFHLTPACGEAIVSGRFRLAKSQDVYVLAQRNDGSLFVSKQLVKVAVGGCS